MNTLDQPLVERVDELIRSHTRQQILSTTGQRACLEELAVRNQGLEKALLELAREVQSLAASQQAAATADDDLERDASRAFAAAGGYAVRAT